MTRDDLLGRFVIATNKAGGRWRGLLTTYTLEGRAVVECRAVDIGNGRGWYVLPRTERREFDVERARLADEHV